MLKDFIPVSNGEKATEEIAFVEKLWTDKLSSNLTNLLDEESANRNEYRVMRPYLRSLPSQAKILDGGCGAGEWTVFLSKLGFNVTGLDISEKMISKLKEIFPDRNFIRGDLRKTGLADASFDAVFSWGAFEHFEVGLTPCLDEAHRILKPGGLLFFSVPFANGRQLKLRRGERDSANRERMRFYQWRFTREDLKAELDKNGWECLRISPIHKEHGIYRMLKLDYHIDLWLFPLSLFPRIQMMCLRAIGLMVSDDYVSHMLMAVARRPMLKK